VSAAASARRTAVWTAGALAVLAVVPPARAAGDAVRGEQLYVSRCGACHSLDENRAGPAHRGVFGRKAGAASGYDYSPALKASGVVWNERTLDRWLANPEKLVRGQKMGFSVPDRKDRADVIAYLKKASRK
jgi:cytochrome c